MSTSLTHDDCVLCGACCCNASSNQAEGYAYYVEVEDPKSRLLTNPNLRKRYVVLDADGEPHLRIDPSGRCVALTGRLGVAVKCEVYADRPRGCRLVEPESLECRRARRERGLD